MPDRDYVAEATPVFDNSDTIGPMKIGLDTELWPHNTSIGALPVQEVLKLTPNSAVVRIGPGYSAYADSELRFLNSPEVLLQFNQLLNFYNDPQIIELLGFRALPRNNGFISENVLSTEFIFGVDGIRLMRESDDIEAKRDLIAANTVMIAALHTIIPAEVDIRMYNKSENLLGILEKPAGNDPFQGYFSLDERNDLLTSINALADNIAHSLSPGMTLERSFYNMVIDPFNEDCVRPIDPNTLKFIDSGYDIVKGILFGNYAEDFTFYEGELDRYVLVRNTVAARVMDFDFGSLPDFGPEFVKHQIATRLRFFQANEDYEHFATTALEALDDDGFIIGIETHTVRNYVDKLFQTVGPSIELYLPLLGMIIQYNPIRANSNGFPCWI